MLHHQHRVALVPQLAQGGYELAVVAGVQAYARLVQDVDYVHEFGPDLRSQAYALAFAAGERGRRAVEGEVVQTHVQQEAYALFELLEYVRSNGVAARVELTVKR